jgi:hypothetical protein
MDQLDSVTNNLSEILYHLHYSLKWDTKNVQHKTLLTKTRIALRDLEKFKNASVLKSN